MTERTDREMNTVLTRHTARIGGKATALAGCDQPRCERRAYCLRADGGLCVRSVFRPGPNRCSAFIPVRAAAAISEGEKK